MQIQDWKLSRGKNIDCCWYHLSHPIWSNNIKIIFLKYQLLTTSRSCLVKLNFPFVSQRYFRTRRIHVRRTVRDSTRKYFPIDDLHQRQIYVCISAIFRKRYIAVTTAVTWRNSPRNTFQVEILESRVIITKPYARSMAQHKSIYANKSSAARFEHLSHCCTLGFYLCYTT